LVMVVSAISTIVVLALPSENKADLRTIVPEKACEPECCERLMMAQIATIDPEHEPSAGD